MVVGAVVAAAAVVICMVFGGGMMPEEGVLVACLRLGELEEEHELVVQEQRGRVDDCCCMNAASRGKVDVGYGYNIDVVVVIDSIDACVAVGVDIVGVSLANISHATAALAADTALDVARVVACAPHSRRSLAAADTVHGDASELLMPSICRPAGSHPDTLTYISSFRVDTRFSTFGRFPRSLPLEFPRFFQFRIRSRSSSSPSPHHHSPQQTIVPVRPSVIHPSNPQSTHSCVDILSHI